MACISPFSSFIAQRGTFYSYKIKLEGEKAIPGYTTPAHTISIPYPAGGYCNKWDKYCSGGLDCEWRRGRLRCNWNDCKYQICCKCSDYVPLHTEYKSITVPGIPLWPSIEFAASLDAEISVETEVGLFVFDGGVEPSAVSSLTFEATDVTIRIADIYVKCPLTLSFVLSAGPGESMSASIHISKIKDVLKINIGGVDIDFDVELDLSIVFCLNPTPPMTYANLAINLSFSCSVDIEGINYTATNISALLACPVV